MSNIIYIISSIEQLEGFKGHLAFLVLFAVFVIILISGIYFSYIYASKKRIGMIPTEEYEIPEEGKNFYVKKGITVIGCVLVLASPVVMMHFLKLLNEEPEKSDGLWLLIDFLILAFFIFSLLLLTGLRSYVFIHQEGFEYRRIIGKKSFRGEDIQFVLESSNFLFIKLKSCKFPIVLETIYTDYDYLLQMLRSFNNPLSNYNKHNENSS